MTLHRGVVRHLGLRIDTELALPAPPCAGPPDVVVRCGPPRDTEDCSGLPSGTVVASHRRHDRPVLTAVRHPGGEVVRVHTVGDFDLDADGRVVRVHRDRSRTDDHTAIVFAGTIVAYLLTRRGRGVLHGSAVQLHDGIAGGPAVGLIGSSGMGKSTLTALLCAAGAALVGDDVLVVDDAARVVGRTQEVRLRPSAAEVADLFEPSCPRRPTADGRLALSPPGAPDDATPLAVVVSPRPSRTVSRVELVRLDGAEAMLELARFPRVLGWQDREVLARQFDALATLAGQVTVCRAAIPWGPPFALAAAHELLDRIGEQAVAAARHPKVK